MNKLEANEFNYQPEKPLEKWTDEAPKILLSKTENSQSVRGMRLVTIIQHKIKWYKNGS